MSKVHTERRRLAVEAWTGLERWVSSPRRVSPLSNNAREKNPDRLSGAKSELAENAISLRLQPGGDPSPNLSDTRPPKLPTPFGLLTIDEGPARFSDSLKHCILDRRPRKIVVPTSRDGLSSRTTELRVSVPMPKSVFISYSRKQGEWVWDRLVPCLKAGGAGVLIDREQFEAARALNRQEDEVQDRAELSVLVLSPEYLVSGYCQRELERAIQRDPEFNKGLAIPVKRVECDLPAAIRRPDPLYVDLTDDQKEDPWDQLLRKCEADLGTPAPHWLKARDDIRRYLIRGESVNLTVQGKVQWKPLIDDLRRDPSLTDLREVDLRNPETYARKALVEAILAACGIPGPVPDKPHDLVEFGRALKLRRNAAHLVLTHFDHVAHRADYEIDLFAALRYEMTESRKLVLLIQSQKPFLTLLPKEHPFSSITTPQTVELKGRP